MLKARADIQYCIPAQLLVRARFPFRMAPGNLLKAAAVILLLAGAASAAVPDSPVRKLARSAAQRIQQLFRSETPPAPVPAPVAAKPPLEQQEPVYPFRYLLPAADSRVRIVVRSAAAGARVVVRLTARDSVIVRSLSDRDAVTFNRGPGRIEVSQVSTGVLIELPRSVMGASVEVDGQSYYVKDGTEIRVLGPVSEKAGDEVTFQTRSH